MAFVLQYGLVVRASEIESGTLWICVWLCWSEHRDLNFDLRG